MVESKLNYFSCTLDTYQVWLQQPQNCKRYGTDLVHNPSYSTDCHKLNNKLEEPRIKGNCLNMLEKGYRHSKNLFKFMVVNGKGQTI